MTNAYKQFGIVSTDTAARDADIIGKPPRLPAVLPEARTEQQQQLLDRVGTIVVDGVCQPRQDTDSIAILIRHPELYEAHIELSKKFLANAEISVRDRELAILRVGWLSQAPFEWASHVKIGKQNGITSDEIEWLIAGSAASGWNDHERAVLCAVEELNFDSMITDKTWATLEQTYSDKQLIELVMLIGQYKALAYLQNSLRLPLTPNKEGLTAR